MKKLYASAIIEHYYMGNIKKTPIHGSFECDTDLVENEKEFIRDMFEDRVRMYFDVQSIKLFTLESKKAYNEGFIKIG